MSVPLFPRILEGLHGAAYFDAAHTMVLSCEVLSLEQLRSLLEKTGRKKDLVKTMFQREALLSWYRQQGDLLQSFIVRGKCCLLFGIKTAVKKMVQEKEPSLFLLTETYGNILSTVKFKE